ncbi:MAG: response regulator [Desulfobacterales bacterium]|nr:response regulator [Desulfobacterales bacterium]
MVHGRDANNSGHDQSGGRGTVFGGLGRRLFVLFLVISLVPLAVVSWLSYHNARQSLKNRAIQSMSVAVQLKKRYFQAFFTERLNDLRTQAGLTGNVELLERLAQGKGAGPRDNPVPTTPGQVSVTGAAADLDDFRRTQGYDAILLIDPSGVVLHRTGSGPQPGFNIFSGPHSDSSFSRACRKALARPGRPFCSDMGYFTVDAREPELFLVQAIKNNSKVLIGLMALQMPIGPINDILREHTGQSLTGETLLVGADRLIRSDSRFDRKPTALKKRVNMDWFQEELTRPANASGPLFPHRDPWQARLYTNFRGQRVLGVHSHLETLRPLGLHWTIIAEIAEAEALEAATTLQYIIIGLVSITALLVLLLAWTATRRIVAPVLAISAWARRVATGDLAPAEIPWATHEITELKNSFGHVVASLNVVTQVCKQIAVGDFDTSVAIRGDQDQLGRAVNQMAENLRAVVRQTDGVAQGDYTIEISPRSEKDKLGRALFHMTSTLGRLNAEKERQLWLQSSLTALGDRLHGEHDLRTLSHNILSCIAELLKIQVATMFLIKDEQLNMVGMYAFEKNIDAVRSFRIGRGLVGRAGLDEKIVVRNSLPPDYFGINLDRADVTPDHLVVVPFFFENKIKGVMEFGCHGRPSGRQLEFLEQAAKNIGIAVNTTESRIRTAILLEQTTQQAEELQVQQEELRQANEELEEQTRALKISEERLQERQEELHIANDMLADRARALETARREIEEKARDLEVTSRYKSDFLANMSHELRTPLNSILILSQLLARNKGGTLTAKQLEYTQTIHTSGSDLLQLINEVLDLAKVESGRLEAHLEEVELEQLIEKLTRGFKQLAAEKGVRLAVILEKGLPATIRTDHQRLLQILRNLLANAFKFTEHGTVTLRLFKPDPATRFTRSRLDPAGAVAFAVTDTGIGIPGSKHDLIFKAFYQADGTTSRKFGGTGLGLSISRRLAKLLGGEIQLQSARGKGSTFTLFVPREPRHPVTTEAAEVPPPLPSPARSRPRGPDKTPAAAQQPETARETIKDDRRNLADTDGSLLVIEHDPILLKQLLDLCREMGFKCLLAEDGEAGLHLADYHRPSGIILAAGLPGINGREVLARLKDNPRTRPIPVHLISAADAPPEGLLAEATLFLHRVKGNRPRGRQRLRRLAHDREPLFQGRRIMVVDDDMRNVFALSSVLEDKGFEIIAARNGRESLEKISRQPDIDLVLMDIMMPEMDGYQAIAALRKQARFQSLPIIALTAKAMQGDRHKCIAAGASDYLAKPFDTEKLLSLLRVWLYR